MIIQLQRQDHRRAVTRALTQNHSRTVTRLTSPRTLGSDQRTDTEMTESPTTSCGLSAPVPPGLASVRPRGRGYLARLLLVLRPGREWSW